MRKGQQVQDEVRESLFYEFSPHNSRHSNLHIELLKGVHVFQDVAEVFDLPQFLCSDLRFLVVLELEIHGLDEHFIVIYNP